MNRPHELSDHEVEEQAEFLGRLPNVRLRADVEALPADTPGVQTASLTDELLAYLAERLPGLRFLAADGQSRVTDALLCALARFSTLEWLDLEWSAVTDAGLPAIAAVGSLRYVDIGGSAGITRAGVARLRESRPDLEVEAHGL